MKKQAYQLQSERLADEITDPESLLQKMKEKFPNELPKEVLAEGGLGRLIGRQDVILYVEGLLKQIHNA